MEHNKVNNMWNLSLISVKTHLHGNVQRKLRAANLSDITASATPSLVPVQFVRVCTDKISDGAHTAINKICLASVT